VFFIEKQEAFWPCLNALLGVVLGSIFLTLPAHATATFSCATAEIAIPAISFEGHAPYSGKELLDFTGEAEIEAGRKIALTKRNVKKFAWKKTMVFSIEKKIAPNERLIAEIRTRASADGIEFPGRYEIRAGKRRFAGKIACSGG
jgi:hypothetical protein